MRMTVNIWKYCSLRLPDKVTFQEGALVDPLAVCLRACRRANIKPGDSVLVCGAEAIGLCALLVARASGAANTIITGETFRIAN